MSHAKMFVRIAIGALIAALVVVSLLLTGAVTELGNMRRGMQEGFELRGSYVLPGQFFGAGISYSLIEAGDEWRWDSFDKGTSTGSGAIRKTADPNSYLLVDTDGAEVGRLHLIYANVKGEGTLYVDDGSGELYKMEKCSRVPGYFEPLLVPFPVQGSEEAA